MEIIESNYFPFERYKELVDKYKELDWREINFQNRVILQLLDCIFINDNSISIVDVSAQYKNKESDLHTRMFYAWKYTPDLLIVKDWNYNNLEKDMDDYLAVVEIKSPVLDPISNNKTHTFDEVEDYRKHGRKVILTDCYEWVFYDCGKEPKHFTLHDGTRWCLKDKNNPEYIVREFGFDVSRLVLPEWDKLLENIRTFILGEE